MTFKVRCYDILGWGWESLAGGGWHAYLDGPATVNRGYGWEEGYHFYVHAYDHGEPGTSDGFIIEVLGPHYYCSWGTLGGGNIHLYIPD